MSVSPQACGGKTEAQSKRCCHLSAKGKLKEEVVDCGIDDDVANWLGSPQARSISRLPKAISTIKLPDNDDFIRFRAFMDVVYLCALHSGSL